MLIKFIGTNVVENKQLGEILARKANEAKGPVAFLLPKKGISLLDADGGAFCDRLAFFSCSQTTQQCFAFFAYNREADEALFHAIKENLRKDIPVYEMENNINDAEFSKRATELMLQLIGQVSHNYFLNKKGHIGNDPLFLSHLYFFISLGQQGQKRERKREGSRKQRYHSKEEGEEANGLDREIA